MIASIELQPTLDVAMTIATVVAAIGALLAAKFARDSIAAARATTELAAAARQADERHRRRDRLEQIGRLIAEMLFNPDVGSRVWARARANFGQALVGLETKLPACLELRGASTTNEVHARAPLAGQEIDAALLELSRA